MLIFTKEEVATLQKQRIEELVKVAGSMAHLAKMIEVPVTTVQSWVKRGRISKDGAELVQAHLSLGDKFKMNYLRPELLNTK